MKVINSGFTREWSDEVLCTGLGNGDNGCSARLLVELSDLFKTGNTGCYVATFECPECSAHTDVPSYPSRLADGLPDLTDFRDRRRG